jgi:sortase B
MKKVWTFVTVFFLVAAVAAAVYAVHYKVEAGRTEDLYEEIKAAAKKEVSATPTQEATPEPTMTATPTPTPTPVPIEIPIDFDALQQTNEDIYAWVTVPGTDVDYPVLQHSTDDSFYLEHDAAKESSVAGAIYSEQKNAKDFSDPNTVLYGHNMRNGSMFASLHRFEDREFFDENREILVYTPEHIYHYEIFAAYTYDNRHLLNSFDFDDPDVFRDYLEEVYSIRAMNAFFLEDPIVTNEDKILTLSTCNGNSEARYLVQGVLVEVEG